MKYKTIGAFKNVPSVRLPVSYRAISTGFPDDIRWRLIWRSASKIKR